MENKYLEKLAAWNGVIGGIDRMVGAITGTAKKAFKPLAATDTRSLINADRAARGMVKNPAISSIQRDASGKITKLSTPHVPLPEGKLPKSTISGPGTYRQNLKAKIKSNTVSNNAIYTARAKLGAGALAVAGAGALGYNKGRSSNDVYGGYSQQSPQYY